MGAENIAALIGLAIAIVSIIRLRQQARIEKDTAQANLEKMRLENGFALERQEFENDRERELDSVKQRADLQEQLRTREQRLHELERAASIHIEFRAVAEGNVEALEKQVIDLTAQVEILRDKHSELVADLSGLMVLKETTVPDLRRFNEFLQSEVLARLKMLTEVKAHEQSAGENNTAG